MLWKNYDTAKELTLLEIKNTKEAAALCDKVAEIIKKFDGKIFNIKLEKALEEATGKRFSVSKNYLMIDYIGQISIQWFLDDRSVRNGEYSVEYVAETSKYLCNIYKEKFEDAPVQNKRIVAENIIPALQKSKDNFLAKAKELEESIDKVYEWEKRIEEVKQQYNDLYKEIPFEIRDYFGLRINPIY